MRFFAYLGAAFIALVVFVVSTVLWILPHMNWSATAKPGILEARLASSVRERWITIHSGDQPNPFALTSDNLSSGRHQYNEHCAACHGVDGDGANRFAADFYPPPARLTGGTQKMSDAEIYFVIANGIALSAMPAFGKRHNSAEIWKIVLWTRRLAQLTPKERKDIEREASNQQRADEKIMR